ncbi:TPA: hypothetical protein ACKFCW_003623, partial [Citrobacter farmeri]
FLFGIPAPVCSNYVIYTRNGYADIEHDIHVNDAVCIHALWCFFILYASQSSKPSRNFVGITDPVFVWVRESGGKSIFNAERPGAVMSMACYVCGKLNHGALLLRCECLSHRKEEPQYHEEHYLQAMASS